MRGSHMVPQARVKVKVSLHRFGNFVFRETMSKREVSEEEVEFVVPYAFPEATNPAYSVLWSSSTQD